MFVCSDQTTRMHIARFTGKIINRAFVIWGVCSEGKDKNNPRITELYKYLNELM
jgi:hypothetical protein